MIPHLDQKLWQASRKTRSRQRVFGWFSAFLLAVALIGLIDGLLAQMRTGSDFLELLPGDAVVLSGPLPLKNPVTGDLQAQFLPDTAPLHFQLDEFFAGYWFGNGMWRGTVAAEPLAEQGSYALRVRFRGAAPSTVQRFNVRVWEDKAARRAGSASFIHRFTAGIPLRWPRVAASWRCSAACASMGWGGVMPDSWRLWVAAKCSACVWKTAVVVSGACCTA